MDLIQYHKPIKYDTNDSILKEENFMELVERLASKSFNRGTNIYVHDSHSILKMFEDYL